MVNMFRAIAVILLSAITNSSRADEKTENLFGAGAILFSGGFCSITNISKTIPINIDDFAFMTNTGRLKSKPYTSGGSDIEECPSKGSFTLPPLKSCAIYVEGRFASCRGYTDRKDLLRGVLMHVGSSLGPVDLK